jgi:parvulin-like peptidyl-prolyl isomerase
VIETSEGFEIVLLHQRTEAQSAALEDIRPKVLEAYRQKGLEQRAQRLVNDLRAKARIETYI